MEEHSKKREQHVQNHQAVNFQGMFEDLERCWTVGFPVERKKGFGHQTMASRVSGTSLVAAAPSPLSVLVG